jgi:hypothetical protein
MVDPSTHQTRRFTRDELYAMVWQKPLSRLAEELGISGNGLAKICDRLDVPYRSRGYWAKKEAGKPVIRIELSSPRDGVPQEVDIHPTRPKSSRPPEVEKSAIAAASKVEGIVVPDDLDNLHPRVKTWITDHKKLQKEREQEDKRHKRDAWWPSRLLPDLTERDLYRFRITSSIFKGIEKAGGRIENSPITGKVTFQIEGHQIQCAIVEKLRKSFGDRDKVRKWTAYPDHHQSGLESSGFLRVSVTTYLSGGRSEWIETQKEKVGDILAEIVSTIMAAASILERMKREHQERDRLYREEQERRYQAQRLRELEATRWQKFREFAANWEERGRLLAFLAEIEQHKSDQDEIEIAGDPIGEWVAWAKRKVATLDPLQDGVGAMFDTISRVPSGL